MGAGRELDVLSLEPILTLEQMSVVDAASGSVEALIERAGWEVASAARTMMGGTYGRRVVVIAGKGNNGADGRVAARVLERWGTRTEVVSAGVKHIPDADLLIDAAYGTGFRGGFDPPVSPMPVLAVDLPSGLDPMTGEDRGGYRATVTVTFGAWKPGLLLGEGPRRGGKVAVAPIGLRLDVVEPSMWLMTDDAAALAIPVRASGAHKWGSAVRVLAGSPGMEGAAALATAAALRTGAGMVVASRPDGGELVGLPSSAVQRRLGDDWVDEALRDVARFAAVIVGPGLGVDRELFRETRDFVKRCPVPLVIDADAIRAVAEDPSCLDGRSAATVLTPHDGEFAAFDIPVSALRQESARSLARLGGVALLKGPTTLVTDAESRCAFVTSGDQRLATAGSGDVLSGMIAAILAGGGADGNPWRSVASAAHWHGMAGSMTHHGAVADDIVDAIGPARERLVATS